MFSSITPEMGEEILKDGKADFMLRSVRAVEADPQTAHVVVTITSRL